MFFTQPWEKWSDNINSKHKRDKFCRLACFFNLHVFSTCIPIQGNLIFPDLSFSTYSIKDSEHKNTFLHKLRLYLLISFHFCQISSGIIQLVLHTGSTIWNWHKVKTWLDQMFRQIYQKMMRNGFFSSGYLCLINYWIFDDLFHKKQPVLVILVLVMIRLSGSELFLRKLTFRGCWGRWGCRGRWGQLGWRGF